MALIIVALAAAAAEYKIAERYTILRNRIFGLRPSVLQLPASEPQPMVWGVVIDSGVSFPTEYVLTVITLADIDNTTSIYTSQGGAFVSLGSDPTIAQLSRSLLAEARQLFPQMKATDSFPLPALGRVCIYVLTVSGAFGVEVLETEVARESHPLHSLYRDYQEILNKNPLKWKSLIP